MMVNRITAVYDQDGLQMLEENLSGILIKRLEEEWSYLGALGMLTPPSTLRRNYATCPNACGQPCPFLRTTKAHVTKPNG